MPKNENMGSKEDKRPPSKKRGEVIARIKLVKKRKNKNVPKNEQKATKSHLSPIKIADWYCVVKIFTM